MFILLHCGLERVAKPGNARFIRDILKVVCTAMAWTVVAISGVMKLLESGEEMTERDI